MRVSVGPFPSQISWKASEVNPSLEPLNMSLVERSGKSSQEFSLISSSSQDISLELSERCFNLEIGWSELIYSSRTIGVSRKDLISFISSIMSGANRVRVSDRISFRFSSLKIIWSLIDWSCSRRYYARFFISSIEQVVTSSLWSLCFNRQS